MTRREKATTSSVTVSAVRAVPGVRLSATRTVLAVLLGLATLALPSRAADVPVGDTPSTADAASAPSSACGRVVAIGDLHGAYGAFRDILVAADLVDREGRWIGGDACLVQLGDIVDRGPGARDILDLVMRLERDVPGRVHVLLGNHEVMTMTDDLRSVTPEGYAAFAADETPEERANAFRAWSARFDEQTPPDLVREKFDASFPPGALARRRAFAPDGNYGAWLTGRPATLRLARTLFVHGGVSLRDARAGVEAMNRTVREDLAAYLEARDVLVERGVLDPLEDFAGHVGKLERIGLALAAEARAAEEAAAANVRAGGDRELGAAACDSERGDGAMRAPDRATRPVPRSPYDLDAVSREAVRRAQAAIDGTLVRGDGPLWNRELARADEHATIETVEAILAALDVDRVVIAHTPTGSRHVEERYWGRVVRIDTGTASHYRGQASALEIEDGRTTAIYLGRREPLRGLVPEISDAEIERWLLEGEIVHREPIGTGITKPERLTLRSGTGERRAAFKSIALDGKAGTVLAGGQVDLQFSDRHEYDVAAYRLDRMLGLGLVPVAVLRTIDDREGVVVDWIEGAIMETDRRERGLPPPPPAAVARRQALTSLFDAWIANNDRNKTNKLYVPASGRSYLIDQTRAFRTWAKPPRRYLLAPSRIPRDVFERFRDLDADLVKTTLEDVLSYGQIKALLKRHKHIVAKIEADVRELGEDAVFGRF